MALTRPKKRTTSIELVAWLARRIGGLQTMSFMRYEPGPGQHERAPDPLTDPGAYARDAVRHEPDAPPIVLRRADVTGDRLSQMICELPPGTGLSIRSRIRVGGRYLHIPMVDFRVDPGVGVPRVLDEGMRAIGLSQGAILASGGSYHAYGFRPISNLEWRIFLARCLLVPEVDTRHVGHRLLEGVGSLRISPRRPGQSPPVVERVWW